MRCHYNLVNFLKNILKRHPIARPLGRGMGCLLWIQHMIDILPEFLQSVMQSQITRLLPIWGPPGSCQPQVGPMFAPWTLLSGISYYVGPCYNSTGLYSGKFQYIQWWQISHRDKLHIAVVMQKLIFLSSEILFLKCVICCQMVLGKFQIID